VGGHLRIFDNELLDGERRCWGDPQQPLRDRVGQQRQRRDHIGHSNQQYRDTGCRPPPAQQGPDQVGEDRAKGTKPDPAASTLALAARLRAQLDRVDHLIDGLLMLARAQHGRPAGGSGVDLAELVATALRERAAGVRAGRLTVMLEVPDGTVAWGSPALLARVVDNLVDNAVTHNEPDGWIRIAARCSDRSTALTVETGGRVFDQSCAGPAQAGCPAAPVACGRHRARPAAPDGGA